MENEYCVIILFIAVYDHIIIIAYKLILRRILAVIITIIPILIYLLMRQGHVVLIDKLDVNASSVLGGAYKLQVFEKKPIKSHLK